MPFRAFNSLPADAYRDAKADARLAKTLAIEFLAELQADITADLMLRRLKVLVELKNRLDVAKTVPGIVAEAKAQENDQTYEPGPEFIALIAAVQAAINTIIAPAGSAYVTTVTEDGLQYSTFTIAQTAGLRANIQSIIDAVE